MHIEWIAGQPLTNQQRATLCKSCIEAAASRATEAVMVIHIGKTRIGLCTLCAINLTVLLKTARKE